MYLLDAGREVPTEQETAEPGDEIFPPGLRFESDTARLIYGIIQDEVGKGFSWCFPDAPEILWKWSKLRQILESGAGWTLPNPAGRGLEAYSRLTVQFVDRAGTMLEPLSFIAQPTGDAMLYELTGVLAGLRAPVRIRRLAVDLNAEIKVQKQRQIARRRTIQRELSATEDHALADENLGESDLVALFEALAYEEVASQPTVRRLTHRERMERLRHQRQGRESRTI